MIKNKWIILYYYKISQNFILHYLLQKVKRVKFLLNIIYYYNKMSTKITKHYLSLRAK